MEPVTTVSTATSIIAQLGNLFSGISGKTPHLDFNQLCIVTEPLTNNIKSIIDSGIAGNAAVQNEIATQYAGKASAFMNACNWWKVGNDQWPRIPGEVLACSGANAVYDVTWRVLMWCFGNAPADNFRDAYAASKDVFSASLYPILDKVNVQMKSQIDSLIAAVCSQTPTLTATSTNQTVPTISNLGSSISSTLSSLFGGNTAASSSTQKAGFSWLVIALLVGAGSYLWKLFKK